jgi:hypothetical protein
MPNKPASVKNKELATEISKKIKTARNWRLPLQDKWDRFYELYRSSTNANDGLPWQSNIFVPYVFSTVETIIPKLVSSRPKINIIPREESDVPYAKVQSLLIDYQWDQSKMDEILPDATRQALIYGTSILKVHWEKRIETIKKEVPIDEEMPELGMTEVEVEEVVENHPVIELVDLYDFFWDPKGYSIETCSWVAHRIYRSYDYLLQMQKQGLYKNVTLLKDVAKKTYQGETDKSFRNTSSDINDPRTVSFNSENEDNIELIEYWENDRVIVIANREIIIRDDEKPFNHGCKPFVKFTDQSVPKEFCGIGEVEPIETLQNELNDLRNQRRDNVSLILNKMWKVKNGADVDEDELVSDVGGIVHTNDMDGVEPLYSPDIPNSSYREETLIKADIQQSSGITDYTKGTSSDALANETATGISLMQEAGNSRINLKMMNLEIAIRKLGELIISLNNQFITDEMAIRITGIGDLQWLTIKPEEVKDNFDVIVESGPRIAQNDAIARRQTLELFQMFAGDPDINQIELKRMVLEKFDTKNLDKLLSPPQPMMGEGMSQGELGQVPLSTPPGGAPGVAVQEDLNQMGEMQKALE